MTTHAQWLGLRGDESIAELAERYRYGQVRLSLARLSAELRTMARDMSNEQRSDLACAVTDAICPHCGNPHEPGEYPCQCWNDE